MRYYIYKITNKLDGKMYIGQHKIPENGENFRRYMGKGLAIKEAIKKYGKDNFEKEIIEYIEDDEKHLIVSEREKYWISYFNSKCPNGYNISDGGEGGCSKESAKKVVETKRLHGTNKHSEETKRKMSEAAKGRKFSKEHKQHLSDNHHLKQNHVIKYKNGKIEITNQSVLYIGEKFGTSKIKIRRASELGNMKFGGIILDLQDFGRTFDHMCSKSKDKIFVNPITKDLMTPGAYKIWRSVNLKKYKDLPKTPYNEEYTIKKENFINENKQLVKDYLLSV